MDKRIAFISKIDNQFSQHASIVNKNIEIAYAFTKLGYDTTLYNISNSWFCENSKKLEKLSSFSLLNHNFIEQCIKYVDAKSFSIIWIRHSIYSFNIFRFLSKIKKENPKITICYEIPTYPYKYEFKGLKKVIVSMHQKIIMKKLRWLIDFILGGFNEKMLFNIPVISFTNGIAINNAHKVSSKSKDEKINLIVSGVFWEWYGIDRLISGLHISSRKNVHIHLFGDGNKKSYLKSLVHEYSLNESVTFYGWADKNMLDNLEVSNKIGIGTLAPFRKKLNSIYSLKHREFCANGIPFIYAGNDADFDDFRSPFIYKVPLNNDPIDIELLVQWYNNLSITPEEIRDFAIQHLDWTVKIKKVLNEIEKLKA